MKNMIYVEEIETPCGWLVLGVNENGQLCLCDWKNGKANGIRQLIHSDDSEFPPENFMPVMDEVKRELREYFDRKRKNFDIDVHLQGTFFQCKVWEELRKIEYGHTISYLELARQLGCPSSVRAVANAVGANPISIIVPCHRIIGSDGSLTGYAGGLDVKKYLISQECDQ